MPETVTLTCSAGHTWERPRQRGRPPAWCPEHRPTPVARSSAEQRGRPRADYVPVAERPPAERNAVAIARIDAALNLYPKDETARVLEAIKRKLSYPRNEERDGPYSDLITTLNIHLSQNRIDV